MNLHIYNDALFSLTAYMKLYIEHPFNDKCIIIVVVNVEHVYAIIIQNKIQI